MACAASDANHAQVGWILESSPTQVLGERSQALVRITVRRAEHMGLELVLRAGITPVTIHTGKGQPRVHVLYAIMTVQAAIRPLTAARWFGGHRMRFDLQLIATLWLPLGELRGNSLHQKRHDKHDGHKNPQAPAQPHGELGEGLSEGHGAQE